MKISSNFTFGELGNTPFLSFGEDLFKHIESNSKTPFENLKLVYKRWKKFWSNSENSLPTQDWLRGLIGELSLLIRLLNLGGVEFLRRWEGPQNGIVDFHGNRIGLEAKTTQRSPAIIHINGLEQLDFSNYDSLHLCIFKLEESLTGQSLVDLINLIEMKLEHDEQSLDEYWDRLLRVGYRRNLDYYYSQFKFFIHEPLYYTINDRFPHLTKNSFVDLVDPRISQINYCLELSGLKSESESEVCSILMKMLP